MNSGHEFYTADQIRLRLGISTYILSEQKPLDRDGLKLIAEAGIPTIEILDDREQFQEEDPSTMKQIVAACKDLGLSIASFHSRRIDYRERSIRTPVEFGPPNRFKGLKAEIERSKRIIDHLLDLGGSVWCTHMGIEMEELRPAFETLAKHYEGENIKLLIENGGWMTNPVRAAIEWLDDIDHPQIGMLLDVGHTRNSAGWNPMTIPGEASKILHLIGNRLQHIHLHDFVWSESRPPFFALGLDHHPPFEGNIQWVEIFRVLKEIGYEGKFMFEPMPSKDSAGTIAKVGTVPERMEYLMKGGDLPG